MRFSPVSVSSGFNRLLLVLILLMATTTAMALRSGDFTCEVNSSDTNTVSPAGYTGNGGNIAIPDTIAGLIVTRIGEYAFMHNITLFDVPISSKVTSIDGYAFAYCSNLIKVPIGSRVINVKNDAFPYADRVLYRSMDLVNGPFTEVFRFEGPAGQITVSPLVSVNITSTSFEVIDRTIPPVPAFYYSFEAEMSP